MYLRDIKEAEEFRNLLKTCNGTVYMQDESGSFYNLKSDITLYVVTATMLSDKNNSLELFAQDREDEAKLIKFFLKLEQNRHIA